MQRPVLQAFQALPRLRLVSVHSKLAAVLGGHCGPNFGPTSGAPAAEAALQAAWAQLLPGKEVLSIHAHRGEGRRLPNFDRPEWDAFSFLA